MGQFIDVPKDTGFCNKWMEFSYFCDGVKKDLWQLVRINQSCRCLTLAYGSILQLGVEEMGEELENR
ncbi:unnamed protein product [Boreogadus saida]